MYFRFRKNASADKVSEWINEVSVLYYMEYKLNTEKNMAYVFGPVLSRRLGRSLGVDLLPPKTCSMDCIYCECGQTTHLSNTRECFVPTEAVIAELSAVLAPHPPLDFITFSGAGEPTLHCGLGEIVTWLTTHYPEYKTCLLTNASTLDEPGVAESLRGLSRIVPSLDAVSNEAFAKITRPCSGVTPEKIIRGLIRFREIAPAPQMWLEIFIVPGVNDSDAEIALFADAVRRIRPDKVQLNALDRPGCVDWIRRPTPDIVERFEAAFDGVAPVEMVGKVDYDAAQTVPNAGETLTNRILTTCLRRPCTLDDLAALIGFPRERIATALQRLLSAGRLRETVSDGRAFYVAADQ